MRIQETATYLALTMTLAYGAGRDSGDTKTNGTRPTVTLLVFVETGVDQKAISMAEKATKSIFDHSGIELVWQLCEAGRTVTDDPCSQQKGFTQFRMSIVGARPGNTTEDMLGYTHLFDDGGGVSGVYLPAAAELAARYQARLGDVLGAAIAHEIGHLLLGANAHSNDGVMFAHWGAKQFERIKINELNFASDQSKKLRTEVESRSAKMTLASR